jgi:hypothetical protein
MSATNEGLTSRFFHEGLKNKFPGKKYKQGGAVGKHGHFLYFKSFAPIM